VCTVSGATQRAGVGEFAMGTPLSTVIEELGGGVAGGISMVLPGVSNRILPPDDLDVPLTYEAMADLDTGLGTAGFIVIGTGVDPLAVAHGVARFLSVESCGQCTPCKQDGRAIAEALDRVRRRQAVGGEMDVVVRRLGTIEDGARCFLATQQRTMVASLLRLFSTEVQQDAAEAGDEISPFLVTELLDIRPDGSPVYDEHHAAKQPDWTYDEVDSGQAPADRLRRAPTGSV
jgi:NADH:ubiquinone oxidoreductase subunit F (NADH-binding)